MSETLASRIWRYLFPITRFASGTQTYPTPLDLYAAMLEKLVAERRWQWVDFEVAGSKHWMQVSYSDRHFSLNFAYPCDDDPIGRLAGYGVTLPASWRLDHFSPGKAATLCAPEADLQHCASIVHEISLKYFGHPADYRVEGIVHD